MPKKTTPPPRRRTAPPPRGRHWTRPALFTLAAFGLLLAAAGLRTLVLDRPHATVGGPYTLTNDRGRPVTQADFHGRYTLFYFGYTHCIDVCPLTLATVTAALDQVGPRAATVVPIFVTVDPARDTPPVVHDYVARFSPRIVGLTGTPAQIQPVLHAFHVMARRHAPTSSPPDGDYLMDHSSVLYLMDGDNHLAAMLPVDSSPQAIAERLRTLLPT
ncbi:SCO family protein [Gluconacetobacter takamatsuzukensis]|uniref:SCO family protein n=1 Tax=Gluconacetobacter takamatsuzukensis TaxID=1286190 RepID=A0A7W4KBC6_9PROT|nr:SCO family protein [Gluconacetobacter takamatsuzukensis]MBB2203817.1 SCO family protein [Gluconacetobacter takamatsuzukensis]